MKTLLVLSFFLCLPCIGAAQGRVLLNPDFEHPSFPSGYRFIQDSLIDGWFTTASSKFIEVWHTMHSGVPSFSGSQHIELNATLPSDLYFEVCMYQGETASLSFYHRGRLGVDSARLLVGPPGSEVELLRFGTDSNNWARYGTTFTNMNSHTTIRFVLQPISTAAGSLSFGNFIDSVTLSGLVPLVEFEKPAYSDLEANGGNIPMLLINGSIPVPGLNVDLNITGGSALLGTDYNITNTFLIPAGDYDGTPNTAISIQSHLNITNDNIAEANETINISLANPQGALQINNANCDGFNGSSTVYTIEDDDTLLPVVLKTFKISKSCQQTLLEWTVASEIDNDYYEIERSLDGRLWHSIGQVKSQGQSSTQQHYEFKHDDILPQAYYRLKFVDMNQEMTYSHLIQKTINCSQAFFNIFPNPTHSSKITIQSTQTPAELHILDMYGQLLLNKTINTNSYQLDINALSSGVYQVLLKIDDKMSRRTLIVK